jgi:hypothetical protein
MLTQMVLAPLRVVVPVRVMIRNALIIFVKRVHGRSCHQFIRRLLWMAIMHLDGFVRIGIALAMALKALITRKPIICPRVL